MLRHRAISTDSKQTARESCDHGLTAMFRRAGLLLCGASLLGLSAIGQHPAHMGGQAPRPSFQPQASAPRTPAPRYASPPAAQHYAAPRPGYTSPRGNGYIQNAPQRQQPSPPRSAPSPGYAARPSQNDSAPTRSGPPQQQRPLITAQPGGQAPNGTAPSPRNQYALPSSDLRRNNQQHLGGWLQSHNGESFTGQAQSLRQEPGFNRLPQPQQQRLIDRLHQLDTMPPQQRQRTLGRIENMERLTPERRQQVRSSAEELGAMPDARKQQVRGAFRSLRDLPPEERQQQLQSPAFRSHYNERERQILNNLLSVEPYNPR